MSKLLALFIFSSIFLFNFYSDYSPSEKFSARISQTVTPTPDPPNKNVSIELDRDSASAKCLRGYRPMAGRFCGGGMLIEVTVSAKLENDSLIFRYSVSGGRIIGEGARVTWDLTGGRPGTYTITVNIEDKARTQNQTETKTVTVFDDCCSGDCACPEIFVSASASSVQAGETIIFTANVSDGSSDADVAYNWTISDGKIVEGQGTPVVRVVTNSKMSGRNVKATVNLDGEAFCGGVCVTTVSAESFVASKNHKKK